MDWSAFAPDRPPGSAPAPHAALTSASPASPGSDPGAGAAARARAQGMLPTSASQFGPGQLAAGLDQVHLARSGFPSRGAPSPSAMYPYAPNSARAPPPPLPSPSSGSSGSASAAAAAAASSRPRPPPPQLAPLAPVGTVAPSRFSPASASSVSPLRTSSRTAPTSPALPPLPPPPPPAALPASTSTSSLHGLSQSSHASSSAAPPAPHRPSPQPQPTSKRANPLEDLIATETVYVQDLGIVIKRVAAAWSRANFPPPQLDAMFRAIEAVYRINKALLAKLLAIGPNPSSPKALGDLLMRWVDDVEPAYTRYATTYALDYDSFEPVQANPNLAPILADLAWPASLPQPPQPQLGHGRVTLDRLFELPVYRIQYYQRLYAKLLRSTQEGRSDHALLVSANEKLARLESLCEEGKRRSIVPSPQPPTSSQAEAEEVPLATGAAEPSAPPRDKEEQVLGPETAPDPPPREDPPSLEQEGRPVPPRLQLDTSAPRTATGDIESSPSRAGPAVTAQRTSNDSATFDSPLSSESLRSSSATGFSTANTSTIQSFSPTPDGLAEKPLRIEDLERRLNTDRTLDIFTMQPRRCKLQIQPASLPFRRELRFAATAHVSFTPTSDPAGRPVTHPSAWIVLLTDLFLVCERVTPEESPSANGADFWLVYPPLAGKHLRVTQQDLDSVEVAVMQRERLVVRFDGADAVARARDLASAVHAAAGFAAPAAPAGPAPPPLRQNSLASAYGHALQSPLSSHGHGSVPPPLPPVPVTNARPQLQLQPLQPPFGLDPSRRVVSGPGGGGTSIARPTRGASMHTQSPGGGLVQSPSASSFQQGSSRGASPCPSGDERYSLVASPYGPVPRRSSQSASDFGAGGGDRPDSRQSNGSYSSNRTDSFGRWPEAPPPLPKERTYNGLDISGRGGPLYATSFRRGDNLNVPTTATATMHRARSADALRSDALQQQMHFRMPSQTLLEDRASSAPGSSRSVSASGGGAGRVVPEQSFSDVSPPTSPVKATVPDKTAVIAQMRCKVFLQQHHAVWKSLGTAKLRLFHSLPSNRKQLVVDSDKGGGKTIISTIVLEDGVERVGKTGVAVELSHEGDRTGIVHMLQLKTEQSAVGLFEQLLLGTDRARR